MNLNKENFLGFTKSGLYVITCISTNRHYVGESSNIKARLNAHLNTLKRKIHFCEQLQIDFNNYGEKNFLFQNLIFGTALDQKQRRLLENLIVLTLEPEQRYNVYVNRKAMKEKNPFFGKKHTQEARSQSLANQRKKSPYQGKTQRNEVKQLISRINSGLSNQDRRKAVVIDGIYYESISEASEHTKYTRRIIREHCHNKKIKNFQWYKDKETES